MKKALKITASLLALCILAISAVPFLLKDELYEASKSEIQKYVKADLDFDFSIGIWSSFPQLTLSLENISIKGQDQFSAEKLFSAERISIEVNTLSFLQKEEVDVKINVESPIIHAIITKEGTSNYDIIVLEEDEQAKEVETSEEPSFTEKYTIKVNQFIITDANIRYEDAAGDQSLTITQANIDIKGGIEKGTSIIQTKLTATELSFVMDNIPYLSRAKVSAHTNLKLDEQSDRYYLEENSLNINALELNYDGWVSSDNNGIHTSINGHLKEADIKNILSLIPAIYTNDFEAIKTEGKLTFKTSIEGTYNTKKEIYPAFEIALDIADGKFAYPDLPKSVDKIQAHLHVINKSNQLDHTIVNLKEFSAYFSENPISLSFLYKQPLSTPYIAAKANGVIDFDNIKDFIPLDAMELNGNLVLDLNLAAFVADIEKSNYNKLHANGKLELSNFNYKSPDLTHPVEVIKMKITASTNKILLKECAIKTGSSQFKLKGKLTNFLSYALADGTLKGSLSMDAPLINLNELKSASSDTTATPATKTNEAAQTKTINEEITQEHFTLPERISFSVQTKIDRLIYDNYDIKQVNGKLHLKEQALKLESLTMNTLGGKLKLNGDLMSSPKEVAKCTLKLGIQDFDIIETVNKNLTVQELAPFLQHCSGTFSTQMSLSTLIDGELSPLLQTINASARIDAEDLIVEGSEIQEVAVKQFKQTDLKKLKLKDLKVKIRVVDGKLIIAPFRIETMGYEAIIQGENGLDKTLNYIVALNIPTKDMGKEVNGWIDGLDKLVKKNNIPINIQKKIEMSLLVTGNTDKPTITPAMGNKSALAFKQVENTASSSKDSPTKEIAPEIQKEASKQIEIFENGTKKEKETQIKNAKKEVSKQLNKWLKR